MKIHNKLFLILLTFSFLLVTALILLIQWSIGKGMIEYVNSKEAEALTPVVTQLENEYKKNNDWSSIQGQQKRFADLLFLYLKDSEFVVSPPHRAPLSQPEPNLALTPLPHQSSSPSSLQRPPRGFPPEPRDKINYVLLDKDNKVVVGDYRPEQEYSEIEIVVNEATVGLLAVAKRKKIIDGYELDFIQKQQHYLWVIALMTMLLVTLITFFLARHLAEPIKLIISGMHKLTQGDYQHQVTLNREDELGELSRDFNELAMTLHENESARRRWLANISHELRTPVAILRGELEAMLDKVRPLNTDNIASANDEVKHLQSLINDLQLLTSADIGGMHYRKKKVCFNQWLVKEVEKHRSYLASTGISLVVNIDRSLPINLYADTTRLCQLFENIINNCIKYADASVVSISLKLDKNTTDNKILLIIEDDGVGVATAHLKHLFEYLYRADSARNRQTGGSGLGLSICAHIVAAHQGTISASHAALGGLAINIELPVIK
ncbi:ATP-binding protein [Psychromonas aquatilis]|uniref:histidine kinase n=1 Tax=Psychromonas aquatilis TaxID=2005072 RepID=A0ABU9GUH9_9GAMM